MSESNQKMITESNNTFSDCSKGMMRDMSSIGKITNISSIKLTEHYTTFTGDSIITKITNSSYKCKDCGKIPIIRFIKENLIEINCCKFYKDIKVKHYLKNIDIIDDNKLSKIDNNIPIEFQKDKDYNETLENINKINKIIHEELEEKIKKIELL